ncbi:MAG: hypothetical protein B7Z75_02120 [Acidocella sp. 20-57-95]|nr:MAG: hypothetical protein B7Z75_02120 [Acidocella sp. 20-57-95]
MPNDIVPQNRFLKIDSNLGPNALFLTSIHGSDRISQNFLFTIQIATKNSDSDIRGLLGTSVTLWFCKTLHFDARPLNGLLRKLSGPTKGDNGFKVWQAEIVPQLAFLGYTENCRIYQNQSVLDIIKSVFATYGLVNYEIRQTTGNYQALEYCVQYRETALAFVSRLMESVGLFYWHEHDPNGGKHTLVISDQLQAVNPATPDTLQLKHGNHFGALNSLESSYNFAPGVWTQTDYDFKNPTTDLTTSATTVISAPSAMTSYEIFDFPGGYTDKTTGTDLAKIRIEREETSFHPYSGTGKATSFNAGSSFTVELPDPDTGIVSDSQFLLTSVTHNATDMTQVYINPPSPDYNNSFTAALIGDPLLQSNKIFKPARTIPLPIVHGPQTATVTAASGNQVNVDQYGRVKVRFHWDRNPTNDSDDQSSCFLRVSQIWANNGFGAVQIPRVGEEVIVEFLEGNPDRPIITGRVYNGNNNLPSFQGDGAATYQHPSRSGIKSQSMAGDGTASGTGNNEFSFEDKSGSEQVYLHAQKDFKRVIGNDENITINGKLNETVTGDVTEVFKASQSTTASTKISLTAPNITFNGSEKIFLNSPDVKELKNSDLSSGAYKLSAYGIGMNAYGVYLNTYGLKLDVPAVAITIYGIKADIGRQKLDIFGMKSETGGAFMKNIGTDLKTVGSGIATVGSWIASGAEFLAPYGMVMFP